MAGFTQGLTGFGSVLVALPLLALFMPMTAAVPLICLVACCMNLQMIPKLRQDVRWKHATIFTIGSLPGMLAGVWALKAISASILSAGLGVVILVFALFSLVNKGRTIRPMGTAGGLTAGFLSGWLNGAIGAGGPPVIIFSYLQPWTKDEIKSTLLAFFVVGGLGIIAVHLYTDLYTRQILLDFAISLPAMIIGVHVGSKSYSRLSSETYRQAVCYMLLIMGAMSLGKPVAAWISQGYIS